jgi:hypothetical protein
MTTRGGAARGERQTARGAVEPGRQRFGLAQRAGLASQHEKGRLENVLGVLHIAQSAAADAVDHRPVPREQGGEGVLIALLHEALQQGGVTGRRFARPSDQTAEMAEQRFGGSRHESGPRGKGRRVLFIILAAAARTAHSFSPNAVRLRIAAGPRCQAAK